MPIGLIQEAFFEYSTYAGGTYSYADVRLKKAVIRALVDKLVATGLWTITTETIPTANFEADTTYYRIWIKFKNSNHLIQIYTNGGVYSGLQATFALYRAASTTTVITSMSFTLLNGNDYTYPFAALGLVMMYGSTWCIITIASYYGAYYNIFPSLQANNVPWFGGCEFYDIATPTTKIDVSIFSETGTSDAWSAMIIGHYLNGSNTATGIVGMPAYGQLHDIRGNYMVPLAGLTATNWRVTDWYAYTNAEGAPTGAILSMGGYYYRVVYTDAGVSYIAKLGAVPTT